MTKLARRRTGHISLELLGCDETIQSESKVIPLLFLSSCTINTYLFSESP